MATAMVTAAAEIIRWRSRQMQENETLQSPQSRPLSFMDYRLALDAIVKAAKKMFFIPLVLMVLGAALLCGYRWYK